MTGETESGDPFKEPFKLAEGYEYIGCFHDKHPMSKRDMPLTSKKEFPENSAKVCADWCAQVDGATFFGLQKGEL